MKHALYVYAILSVAIFSGPAQAATVCNITLTSCPKYPTVVGTFVDSYIPANSNEGECMQRAVDYYSWCGLQPQSANNSTATYVSNGVAVQSYTFGNSSVCMISQNTCPNYPSQVGSFADYELAASQDINVCSQRAEQYYAWCGTTPGSTVQNGEAITQSTYYHAGFAQTGYIQIAQQFGITACMITQTSCHNYPTVVGTFVDDDLGASSNPGECMQRSIDYYNWCGGAAFGSASTANYFSGGSIIESQYSFIGGNRLTRPPAHGGGGIGGGGSGSGAGGTEISD